MINRELVSEKDFISHENQEWVWKKQKKLCIWTHFKQCQLSINSFYINNSILVSSNRSSHTDVYGCLFVAKMHFCIQWNYIYNQWKIFDIWKNKFILNKTYMYSIKIFAFNKKMFVFNEKYLIFKKIHLHSIKYICVQ